MDLKELITRVKPLKHLTVNNPVKATPSFNFENQIYDFSTNTASGKYWSEWRSQFNDFNNNLAIHGDSIYNLKEVFR